jgi:hypothetical protein
MQALWNCSGSGKGAEESDQPPPLLRGDRGGAWRGSADGRDLRLIYLPGPLLQAATAGTAAG